MYYLPSKNYKKEENINNNLHINKAIEILNTPEPLDKVKLTLDFKSEQSEIISFNKNNVHIPNAPARPRLPELINPKNVQKRSTGIKGLKPLIHSFAHIELNAIDLAWDLIARFGDKINDTRFFSDWLIIAKDEAQHFVSLNNQLKKIGSYYGEFPAHNGLWDAATKTSEDLLSRLAVIPMFFEARGLDTAPKQIAKFQNNQLDHLAKILETIYLDEINHLRIGVFWFEYECKKKQLDPIKKWKQLIRKYLKTTPKEPINSYARTKAGMRSTYWTQFEK